MRTQAIWHGEDAHRKLQNMCENTIKNGAKGTLKSKRVESNCQTK